MSTVNEFIKDLGITVAATRVDANPNMADSADMDHWRLSMRSSVNMTKMTVYFSMGRGLNGREPKLDEVLDCIASDAASVENAQSFEDWCGELGFDTDSRKAHRIYSVCKRQAERLRKFVGINAYNDLLWETERL